MAELPDTLEEWWDDFVRSLRRKNRSDKTITRYRASFERFWRWALAQGHQPDPSGFTHHDINAWTDHLRTETTLQPVTVTTTWTNARPFWSWWASEIDEPSPFTRADHPGDHLPPVSVRSIDEIRALLATCSTKSFRDRRDEAIIRIFYDSGPRVAELVGMDVTSWDRKHDWIEVLGKGSKPRIIPTGTRTGEALARYVRARRTHPDVHQDRLWLGRKGPLRVSGVEQMLARRSERAGVDRIAPHQLRHTWSHQFRMAGGSDSDLMYLAGWETTAMAARYGRSAAAERAREAHRAISPGDRL